MNLGQNITAFRKKLKLSQNDLGKIVGTSGDIIGRYERDEVKPSDFFGIFNKDEADKFEKHTQQIRNEWDRNI